MSFRMFSRRSYTLATGLLAVLAVHAAYCSDVVVVDAGPTPNYADQQLAAAARVYGLDVQAVALKDASDCTRAIAAIGDPKSIGVVLMADALQSACGDRLLSAMDHEGKQKPLMIAGITDRTNPAALTKWSEGFIRGSQRGSVSQGASYLVAPSDGITRQLGGAKLPIRGTELQYLKLGGQTGSHWLIAASDGSNQYPTLAIANINGRQVFFVTAPPDSAATIPQDLLGSPFLFPVIAPQLLFLNYAAGDRAWHFPGHYANLTIDDIWLREPYGYVDYDALLQEMQQHNFHTTLAFIPWNFDRSQPALVTLFREHPDRYSISVHGDNHDHQEFGPFSIRPLSGQISDMKQGLARMAAFQRLTDLPWDPVMIFPHKMSPEGTLAALKRYNYWATVNADNIPSDATAPADPAFALRPVTLAFANFPSVRRYSAENLVPDWLFAMDAFLGNPILFYCHEAYFSAGIGVFDGIADKINHLQPDTQWAGLGTITQHFYLEKLRDDGNYDVQLLSPTIRLTSDPHHATVFFLQKEENGAVPFSVSVDGQPAAYDFSQGVIRAQVAVPAGVTREFAVTYQNDFVPSKTDIAKSSLRIAVIRHLSDFRDDVVSRSGPGRWFIRSYVANRSDWNHGAEGVGGVALVLLFLWWRSTKKKRWAAARGSAA